MARFQSESPYRQSRAALRERYGSRAIDASAPNVTPGRNTDRPGNTPGGTSEGDWRAFFGPKPTGAPSGPPALWKKMRANTASANVAAKPIGDPMRAKVMADTSPTRGLGGMPTQPSSLAPEGTPDPVGMASLYEPPAQFGGKPSLLQDPEGFGLGDFGSPIGGSSAFFRKYGKMRDLSTLGQDNFIL